jgi:hypothetical protein
MISQTEKNRIKDFIRSDDNTDVKIGIGLLEQNGGNLEELVIEMITEEINKPTTIIQRIDGVKIEDDFKVIVELKDLIIKKLSKDVLETLNEIKNMEL